MDIRETADMTYRLAHQIASEQGSSAIILIVGADGAYQMRSGPLDINVMVGVLMRSVHVAMQAKTQAPSPGEAVFEDGGEKR